jgi:ubiquitin-conjugating enzyme E2 I
LNEEKGWKASISVKQILVGVQDLLDNPNNDDAANSDAYASLKRSKEQYKKRVIEEVKKYSKNYAVDDDDVIIM